MTSSSSFLTEAASLPPVVSPTDPTTNASLPKKSLGSILGRSFKEMDRYDAICVVAYAISAALNPIAFCVGAFIGTGLWLYIPLDKIKLKPKEDKTLSIVNFTALQILIKTLPFLTAKPAVSVVHPAVNAAQAALMVGINPSTTASPSSLVTNFTFKGVVSALSGGIIGLSFAAYVTIYARKVFAELNNSLPPAPTQ